MFLSIESKHPKFYQVFRIFIVFFASILYAWNLRCFAKTAGLFPGGFSGVSLLLQKIGLTFFHIDIPYTFFNVVLNIFPIYIGFRFLGKKFTWYSILTIFLSSIFVDLLPAYVFTQDVLLISVFGGLLNGFIFPPRRELMHGIIFSLAMSLSLPLQVLSLAGLLHFIPLFTSSAAPR